MVGLALNVAVSAAPGAGLALQFEEFVQEPLVPPVHVPLVAWAPCILSNAPVMAKLNRAKNAIGETGTRETRGVVFEVINRVF